MNKKEEFNAILQVCLLSNDGLSEDEIKKMIGDGVNEKNIKRGVNLCKYLNGLL